MFFNIFLHPPQTRGGTSFGHSRPHSASLWLCALFAFLVPFSAKGYQQIYPVQVDEKSGVEITLKTLMRSLPETGFCPVRVEIRNDTREAHTWSWTFTGANFSGSSGTSISSGYRVDLSVGAGQSRGFDLLVPRSGLEVPNRGYGNLVVAVDGYAARNSRFYVSDHSSGGFGTAYVAMSERLGSNAWSKLETEVRSPTSTSFAYARDAVIASRFHGISRTSGRQLAGSQVNPKELPPDARALSGFGGYWLSDRDWLELSTDRRAAVRQWVEEGGRLFVAADAVPQPPLPALPAVLDFDKPTPLGFGAVKLAKLENKELKVDAAVEDIMHLDGAPLPAWHADFERDWPLIDFVGFPQLNVKLLIAFIFLFAVVIGPVNLISFAPPQRRHRLFFTVPLLSIGASAALLGVIAIGDGFGAIGTRNALLLLPAGENRMVLAQEQVTRSRLLLSRSFSLPETASLSAIALGHAAQDARVLHRQGQQLSGDWFRSRAVQAQVLRSATPSRAEVVLQPNAEPGGVPRLLSSVPATLRQVFYVDAEGKYWQTPELTTGRPATLQASNRAACEAALRSAGGDFSANLRALLDETAHRPGYFYALADPMPGALLDTLPSIQWKKQTVLCLGPCTKPAEVK